jgi:hypothetical protein
VAQHEWLIDARIADATFGEPVDVRTTDANGCHTHERLAGSWHRHRFIVQAQVFYAVQSNDLHDNSFVSQDL